MADRRYRDEDWLYEKYHEDEKTTEEIAEMCGVADSTIYRALKRHEIPLRDFDPEERTRAAREAATEKYGEGGPLKHLWKENTDEMMDHAKQNAALGTPARKVNGMAGVTGQDHPHWRGGKSLYDALKKQLRPSFDSVNDEYRDEHCQMCGVPEAESDRALEVHHIVPLLAGGTNEAWNMMTLCRRCHTTAEWFTRELTEAVLTQ